MNADEAPPEPATTPAPAMTHWGPDPSEGVRKYVEKIGHGHGIGYGYSKRLIEFFGHAKLPAVIKSEPHKLVQAVGRSNFDWQGLSQKWRSKTDEEHAAMMAMLSYRNISYADAARICKCYGFARGVAVVHEDPYQLSFDVDGIGFERADRIATEAGTGKGSSKRARAALFHSLNKATEDGDTYVSHKDWINKAEWLMGRSHGSQLNAMIEQLVSDGYVYVVLLPDEPGKKPNPKPQRVYYPRSLYLSEVRLAKKLRELSQAKVTPPSGIDEHIAKYEEEQGIKLSESQRDVVRRVADSPLVVVTGGPGTGKTTATRAVVHVFGNVFSFPMSLAAFAGCAAKRLRESSGSEALTIHKTLEFDPVHERFNRDADNPLESDLVVLDETSMIDVQLLDNALQAVRVGARVLLIGDVDQLPSIGPGAALRDIIEAGIAPVVRLDTIFRQSARSRIVTSARRIREGVSPIPAVRINQQMEVIERPEDPDAPKSSEEPLRDYVDVEVRRPPDFPEGEKFDLGQAVCETVVRLVKTIEKRYGIKPEDVQVLSPMRIKTAGADELNKALQAALNPPLPAVNMLPFRDGANVAATAKVPPKKILQIGSSPREDAGPGDKVMQLRNDYQKQLYNGDIGFITSIDHAKVIVDFRDGLPPRTYNPAGTSDIKLAYASTTHKSQGSEYPCVVIVVMSSQAHMFRQNGRSLFYTAVTRGKKLVFIVHDEGAVEKALSAPARRRTLLRQRLQGIPIRYRTGPLETSPSPAASPGPPAEPR